MSCVLGCFGLFEIKKHFKGYRALLYNRSCLFVGLGELYKEHHFDAQALLGCQIGRHMTYQW